MDSEKTIDQILAEFEAQKQENKWAYDKWEEKKGSEGLSTGHPRSFEDQVS